MGRATIGRGGAFALVLSGMVIACGGAKKPAPNVAGVVPKAATLPAAPRTEVHEKVTPRFCASRTKLARLLGNEAAKPAPPPPADETAESAAPPTSSVSPNAKLAGNQAYRAVAPGTVLIRSEHGMGTGVIVDAKGYALTNYHVIADGKKDDFVVKVDVTFGDLTSTGRMTRQERSYDGIVVKADPVRDLALVRVVDPPAKLIAVKLAKSAPQIAEKVISVGHAGIGFLWAAKTCSVASIGERQQDASMLASLDCSRADASLSPEEATRTKKACDDRKKLMNDTLLAQTQGLAIQTDCAITHGDSGGPLVNAAGEIVGLNQSISADLATASFHVHLDELRDFAATHGEEGVALVPDPYCDGGLEPSLEDVDLDGTPDTLVTRSASRSLFGGDERMGVLIDLDQDHFTRPHAPNDPFDAEIALLVVRDTAYVWFDTDDDARFDVLLVDKNNDGEPELAYRIDAEGRVKEDKTALPKHDFSGKYVKDASLHPRLGKIADAIGGSKYTSARMALAGKEITLPDALRGGGLAGRATDTDRDGRMDLVVTHGAFSRGLLVDADQDSLLSLKSGDAADELLKAKKVDAEISVITQGRSVWAMYDTDNDGKFDLALMNGIGDESFASAAWKVNGTEMTPAPEHVGRKLLRPGLVSFPRAASALKAASYDIATDEGFGSLPDPLTASRSARFRFRDVKGYPKGTVVESSYVTLIDLDHDTKLTAKEWKDADPDRLAKDGKIDAEIAVVRRGSAEWVYYDTDGDNRFDLVLFVPSAGKEPSQAFRIAKGATALEIDPKSVAGRPLRTRSAFTSKPLLAKWKGLAPKLFKAELIEE